MSSPNVDPVDLDLGQTIRGFAAGQKLFGRYSLVRILGRGGMGVVWLARDEKLECDVALKFLPELITHDAAVLDGLKRETKRSLRLTHHNIVRIYDFAEDGHSACISMEYVDGPTLSALRVQRPSKVFEIEDLKPWIEQTCEALDYAHTRAKIVHRDLKPANLMVNSGGELKIADFGISRSLTDSVSMMTLVQGTSGTLVYMSPQQLDGARASHLDDIYSLGATIYDLLTSRPPFYSGQIDRQIREKTPSSMSVQRAELEIESNATIPDRWEQTIAACLAKDPGQRPQSAAEVANRLGLRTASYLASTSAIADVSAAKATTAKRLPLLAIVTAVVALLLVVASVYYFVAGRHQRAIAPAVATAPPIEATAPPPASPAASVAPEVAVLPAPTVAPTVAATAPPNPAAIVNGSVSVSSKPAGATVSIGDQTGRTPVNLSGLTVGKQTLKVALDGYEPVERDIDVKENEITDLGNLTLERSRGSAQITSTPQGISFELIDADGGHHKGKTPATIEKIPAGSAKIIFKRKGIPNHEQQLAIVRNQAATARWQSADGAQPSATPQEGKPIAENAALNGPPNIRKLLGTFRLHHSPDWTGDGSLTVTLSKDGTKITAVGHYNESTLVGGALSIVFKGSFSGTAPITSVRTELITSARPKIKVTGQWSETRTAYPDRFNRQPGELIFEDTEYYLGDGLSRPHSFKK